MTTRANIDKRYYLRFMLIGAVAVGFALWSVYDGAVTYPNQRERALAYLKLEEEGNNKEWPAFAEKKGWPTENPGEPKKEVEFKMQFIMAGVAGSIGLWLLFGVWRSRGRWIEANESGLQSSWGASFDFDSITSLDKKKWKNKGIAKITYQDANRRKRFVLDNYKYDRVATDAIIYEVESKIGADIIVGGPPEPPRDEHDREQTDAAHSDGERDA